MKTYIIYRHINKINGKSYIGLTCQKAKLRWKNGTGYNKDTQPVFYNAIQKYGWENFDHEILETDINSLEKANERERYWIAYYHTWIYDSNCNGYNNTQGGDGNLGHKVSDEAKLRMSFAHKGQISWAKGKKLSDEHKKHLSEAHLGKTRQKHSEQTKKKMSEAALGRRVSEQTKQKIAAAQKGRIPWNKGKTGLQTHIVSEKTKQKIAAANGVKIKCIDQNTQIITYYYSISEAIRQLQQYTTNSLIYQFNKLTHNKIEYIIVDHYKLLLVKENN